MARAGRLSAMDASAEPGGVDPAIDPRVFIKQLAPEQLGVFEPLSGMTLLNLDDAAFRALGERFVAQTLTDADTAVIRTINHETYHFAQATASGYVFHRQARAFEVLNASEPVPEPPLDPDLAPLLAAARVEAEGDPALERRLARLEAMLAGHQQIALMDARAGAADHSMAGAMLPAFFEHLNAVGEAEHTPGPDGLSVAGLLEGSAVLHTHLLMHPQDAHLHVNAELQTLPPVYHELVALTAAAVGQRTLELALPATALALRYMAPHVAYKPLLAQLALTPMGEGLAHGRALAAALPEIDGAGPVLGTALELRALHDGYRIYDPFLDRLRTAEWGVNSYDLLADPSAMHRIGGFPMGVVTADGYHGPLPAPEMAARMAIMGLVLRTQSRRRAERQFRQFQLEWAQEVLGRLMGGGGQDSG